MALLFLIRHGERVGLIKFGSRTDILMEPSAEIQVKVGERVKGGASVVAFLGREQRELAAAGSARESRRS